ncbi:hypothetical protein [Methylophilus methylotrophus]|uniref:hypothetical protein n=1 Tax=Methylophilus methylotrophus TaxID=17 RepID=UPI000F5A2E55|nr:hypothetical protein [Methylophilus methylotrophus]
MKAGFISSQSFGLPIRQQPREAQHQGLWQQQLENASLWKTNLAITAFESKNPFLSPGNQADLVNEAGHLASGQFTKLEKEALFEDGADHDAFQEQLGHTEPDVLPHGNSDHLGVSNNGVINAQYNGKATVSADKSTAEAFSQRVKSFFTNELAWQKKHLFMSDIDGVKQIWIRDSAITKAMTSTLASSLLASMSQLGVELSRVTVNGQVIFQNNHEIKE